VSLEKTGLAGVTLEINDLRGFVNSACALAKAERDLALPILHFLPLLPAISKSRRMSARQMEINTFRWDCNPKLLGRGRIETKTI